MTIETHTHRHTCRITVTHGERSTCAAQGRRRRLSRSSIVARLSARQSDDLRQYARCSCVVERSTDELEEHVRIDLL